MDMDFNNQGYKRYTTQVPAIVTGIGIYKH